MPTELDEKIGSALLKLNTRAANPDFDYESYRRAFEESANEKAKEVISLLNEPDCPMKGQRPVFVSVGGADATELDYLLRNSNATHGILLEGVRALADAARRKSMALRTLGKVLEVYEGDAKETINEACAAARKLAEEGNGDFIAVTCHAVIHELFDRGKERFDPLAFFASIFQDAQMSTWFTYREPGTPEKWGDTVLLRASCSAETLLQLTNAICGRHLALRELLPVPCIVGDSVRLHPAVAFEVISKLFYLDDLSHEISERSTSVNHTQLVASLLLAIGETARAEKRATVVPISAPTRSFRSLWSRHGVIVRSVNTDFSTVELCVPESHTRIVAYRSKPMASPYLTTAPIDSLAATRGEVHTEIARVLAKMKAGDIDGVTNILLVHGRSWVESPQGSGVIALLHSVRSAAPRGSLLFVWSNYLLSLNSLFAGNYANVTFDDPELAELAQAVGLGHLFRAENMELLRKKGQYEESMALAASLAQELAQASLCPGGDLSRYSLGTAAFLLSNFLRGVGCYRDALLWLQTAEPFLRRGIPSHDTELSHCLYAKNVCYAVVGKSYFDPVQFARATFPDLFAGALLLLSYSHAAWFVERTDDSIRYADQAANAFTIIGADRYSARAASLAQMIRAHENHKKSELPDLSRLEPQQATAVAVLCGYSADTEWLSNWLGTVRPSVALGLLQFASGVSPLWQMPSRITLPRVMDVEGKTRFAWKPALEANSMAEADTLLRRQMQVPLGVRVPLLAD